MYPKKEKRINIPLKVFQTTPVSMLMKSADGTKLGGVVKSQEDKKIIEGARGSENWVEISQL